MEQLIKATIEALKNSPMTLKEISSASGIQITRIHRLRHGKEMMASEFVALAKLFQVDPDSVAHNLMAQAKEQAEQIKKEATEKAWTEIYQNADAFVAKRYGITPELLEWRLSDPKLKAQA